MAICLVEGSLEQLSIAISDESKHFYGDLSDIEFFASGEERPKKCRGYIDIYRENDLDAGDRLRDEVVLGKMDETAVARTLKRSSHARISVHLEGQEMSYGVVVSLPRDTFEEFARIAEPHLGKDIMYSLSFEYPLFADGRDGRAPTSQQFYAGAALHMQNKRIDVLLRPGPLGRNQRRT